MPLLMPGDDGQAASLAAVRHQEMKSERRGRGSFQQQADDESAEGEGVEGEREENHVERGSERQEQDERKPDGEEAEQSELIAAVGLAEGIELALVAVAHLLGRLEEVLHPGSMRSRPKGGKRSKPAP